MNINLGGGGDLESAETCLEKVHAADRTSLGMDHAETAMSLSALADVQAARGDLEPAVAGWTEAAAIMLRALGSSHPNSAWARSTIGVGLVRAGQVEKGLPYLEQAVAMMVAGDGGAGHRVGVRTSLAIALERNGRKTECMEVLREILKDQESMGDNAGAQSTSDWLQEISTSLEESD